MTETVKKSVNFVTKSLVALDNGRIFEGIATAQIVDKQGEMAIVDAFIKSIPKWLESGGFIIDWHSNRVVGKALGYEPVTLKEEFTNTEIPAVKIKAEIFNRGYALDDEVWNNIKNGTYKGLSFGGAVRSGGRESVEVDGRLAYALKDIELYEISVCPSPVNPIAVITDFNMLAKAEGNKVCSSGTCYYEVLKADDDAVSEWISELHREHPDWKHDQVVAVAHEKVRRGEKKKAEYTVKIEFTDDVKKGIEEIVDNRVKGEISRMYINPTKEHINQSIMSAEEQKTVTKSETSAPAASSAPVFDMSEFTKAITKSFGDAVAPLATKLDELIKVKALDTPTNLQASAPGGNVIIPNKEYHGLSEQGSKTQGSKEPAETDKVHLEQKAEDKKEEKEEEIKKSAMKTEEIIKAKTPRPNIDVINPTIAAQKGNSILEYVRKSGDPNALSNIARALLIDRGTHDRILKGEGVFQ